MKTACIEILEVSDEHEEYSVMVRGCGEGYFDDYYTEDHQDAVNEAESWRDQMEADGYRVESVGF